jgi:2'-hydroxyisoflavone reductase
VHTFALGLLSALVLGLSATAPVAAADPAAAPAAAPASEQPAPKRILILGGTGFLGPHVVEAASARGHQLTLFNRGKTRPELFKERPEIEILHGDRDPKEGPTDLKSLADAIAAGTRWDAVVDTSGYKPRVVKESATLLGPALGQYVFISTISVFADDLPAGITEDAPLATMPDETNEDVQQYYGALKALCEQAAEKAMPGRVTNIRPGLIVGPGDPTDRFTYWPVHAARGGEFLCPGDGEDPYQVIDGRDLAAFIVRCIEEGTVGVFNATGPATTLTMKAMVDGCLAGAVAHAATKDPPAAATTGTPVWADTAFLEAQGVAPWGDLPGWVPRGPDTGITAVDCSKAIAAGLSFRPIADIARDTLQWWDTLPPDRTAKLKGGSLTPEREAAIIAAWKESQAGR